VAYYTVCCRCGAYLDPGEQCDCFEEEEKIRKRREKNAKEIEDMMLTEKKRPNAYGSLVMLVNDL
jgi:hypothetical protein